MEKLLVGVVSTGGVVGLCDCLLVWFVVWVMVEVVVFVVVKACGE